MDRAYVWLLSCLVVAASCRAQAWTAGTAQPGVAFGVIGDQLARDAQGLLGYDDLTARTFLPSGSAWVPWPATVPTRSFATLVTSGTRAFLFGGLENGTPTSSLWVFDRPTVNWVPCAAVGPSPRSLFGAARLQDYVVLFFGGLTGSGISNETWILFDLAGGFWMPQTTPPGLPGRVRQAMATGPGSSVVMFGGTTATTVLGDTWIFRSLTWTQFTGLGPPPAVDARAIYDPGRDITVLVHPNGETWEWDDFRWRRVPATGAPAWGLPAMAVRPGLGGGVRAFHLEAAGLVEYAYVPSTADYQISFDATCSPYGGPGLELVAYQRSLPLLGQSLHLRATGVGPASLFVGAYELSAMSHAPLGCGCWLMLDGTAAGTQFVPGTTTVRDWLLPIAASPALVGVSIDVQGFHLDPAAACWLMSTQRGTLVPGW